MDADGDFIVNWVSFGQEGRVGRMSGDDAAGIAEGGEFRVKHDYSGDHASSSVGMRRRWGLTVSRPSYNEMEVVGISMLERLTMQRA